MFGELRELFNYRDLVRQLVIRDLKVRYKNSVLGFLWSLANPLIQVITITLIVKYVLQVGIRDYSAYLLVGFLPWAYFQMALLDSSQVVLLHRDLLRKVYFPREVLPLSVVAANLVHFLLALVVFFAYLIGYIFLYRHGAGVMATTVWLPVLVAMQTLLIIGLTFFVSCLNVFYEDTKYLLAALLNVFFYLTPVMYPSEFVRETLIRCNLPSFLYTLYQLNPINIIVEAYRKTLLPPPGDFVLRGGKIESLPLNYAMLAVAAVICIAVAWTGNAFFNSRKWVFAERE